MQLVTARKSGRGDAAAYLAYLTLPFLFRLGVPLPHPHTCTLPTFSVGPPSFGNTLTITFRVCLLYNSKQSQDRSHQCKERAGNGIQAEGDPDS